MPSTRDLNTVLHRIENRCPGTAHTLRMRWDDVIREQRGDPGDDIREECMNDLMVALENLLDEQEGPE